MTRILVSNDDGYHAPGIEALYEAVKDLGDVVVMAPEQNCSGASNSLTLGRPIGVRQSSNGFYSVSGTPTDCVHLAATGFFDVKPDIVISGINNGQNMGDDTLYSGTVAAAMEGLMLGVPSIAFSQVDRGWAHIEDAALMARAIVQLVLAKKLSGPMLWNVNIPNLPFEQLKAHGAVTTRLGRRHAAQDLHRFQNPRGETMYWIGAAGEVKDGDEGTDFYAVANGQTSITPLQVDLTGYEQLQGVHGIVSDLRF